MLPTDLTLLHTIAISCVFVGWFAYPVVLRLFGLGPLNSQLGLVRHQWVTEIANRSGNPFDAILLGHLVHSVAFFGSATLIVLAGLFSIVLNLEAIHETVTALEFFDTSSLQLFALEYALVASVLTICFFSFTYSLRKILYSIALIGALPDKSKDDPKFEELVHCTTTVVTEALKTFNFGIRGYYYAVASLFLFISPEASIAATFIATVILIYRQIGTPTSRAISNYIDKIQKENHE